MGTSEAKIQLSDGRELVIGTEIGDAPDFEVISRSVYLNRVPVAGPPVFPDPPDGRTLSRFNGLWIWNGVPVTEEEIPALMELEL